MVGDSLHTRDVVIKYIIFLDHVVDYLLGVIVDYQTFPLARGSGKRQHELVRQGAGASSHIAFCDVLDLVDDD